MNKSVRVILYALERFAKKYAKELIIAFCFAIIAAVVYEYFEFWKLEKSPKWIFEKNKEAIVLIQGFDRKGNVSQGSGFFIDQNGTLVTNYHVIRESMDRIRARLPNGAYYELKQIRKINRDKDLALLEFEGKDFKSVALGDSKNLKTGEKIVVIACPYGFEESVTQGVVSNPRLEIEQHKVMIQMTAQISSGSSGGAVFDSKGKVVGIVALTIASRPAEGIIAQNLNFAIPINEIVESPEPGPQRTPVENYYALGLIAFNNKNYDDAEKYFKIAIEKDRNYLDAYLGLADIYYYKKLYDREIEICKRAVELDPTNAQARFYLGWAYEDKGVYEKALEEYEKSVDLDPDNQDALYTISLLYLILNNKEKALEAIEKLSKINIGTGNELRILFKRVFSN
jgi:V8-like Glu-specific endopeptidase